FDRSIANHQSRCCIKICVVSGRGVYDHRDSTSVTPHSHQSSSHQSYTLIIVVPSYHTRKETPSNTSSASRLRRRWRRGERIRERPHRLHLHLQRRHVVGRFLQKAPSRQRPAPRHQSPKHPQPAPHPLPRFRGPRPPAAAADLAAGPEEEARPAAGAEEDGAAPPGPAAGGEREGGVRGLLDGARPEFGSGTESLEEASAVYPLLRRGPPLGPRLGFWATLHHLLLRTRGR
ncbi:unnamed protein product, partial [Musa acuminata var. zebrina]